LFLSIEEGVQASREAHKLSTSFYLGFIVMAALHIIAILLTVLAIVGAFKKKTIFLKIWLITLPFQIAMNHFIGAGSAGARYAHAQSAATTAEPMTDPTYAETNIIPLTVVVIFAALVYLIVCFLNVYFYIVVYSYYLELTKLEGANKEDGAGAEEPQEVGEDVPNGDPQA
jgi:hypothetical protein